MLIARWSLVGGMVLDNGHNGNWRLIVVVRNGLFMMNLFFFFFLVANMVYMAGVGNSRIHKIQLNSIEHLNVICTNTHFLRLFILQNQAIRIIEKMQWG